MRVYVNIQRRHYITGQLGAEPTHKNLNIVDYQLMFAKLKLIPISRNHCRDCLRTLDITFEDNFIHSEVNDLERRQITLMLCAATNDIIDVDHVNLDEVDALGSVRYGSINEDGVFSVEVALGRNSDIRIRSSAVSRVLCDVVLKRNTGNDAEGFLIMQKPPNGRHVYHNGHVVHSQVGDNIPIHHGSIIALHGPTAIAFEVQILQATTETGEETQEH